MEIQKSSCAADHEATPVLQNEPQGNEEVISEQFRKRKFTDETDDHQDHQNKRSCTRTSAASTSDKNNTSTNHLTRKRKKSKKPDAESGFNEFKQLYPCKFMTLLYQLELSILCSHRKNTVTDSQNSGIFRNSKVGQFNNIVLQYEGEYFCIRVDYFDTRGYDLKSLLTSGEHSLSCYLKEFALELMFYLENVADMPKYLILYTNSILGVTDDVKLKLTDSYVQLKTVNSDTNSDLFRLLESNSGKFYQFADDDETRETLSNLVVFPNGVKNQISAQDFCEGEIREQFFDRLILAVNQPSIEELVSKTRKEVRDVNYWMIREEVMRQLIEDQENDTNQSGNPMNMMYGFNLFVSCVYEMFLHGNISGIKFDERCSTNNVAMKIENSFLYFKPVEIDERNQKQTKFLDINDLFSFYSQQMNKHLDYFVIFTNATLSQVIQSNETITNLEFCPLNISKKNYSMFRHSFIDKNNIFQFSTETRKRIFGLLTIPSECSSQRVGKFRPPTRKVKSSFLHKIIFAVGQNSSLEMNKFLEEEIKKTPFSRYNFEDYQKITIRYLKSHETGALTKELVNTLLLDDSNNFDQKQKSIEREIEFARQVTYSQDVPKFTKFVEFLTEEKGKVCLDTLRKNGIDIFDIANILEKLPIQNAENYFLKFYGLFFDFKGRKTKYLENFESQGFSVKDMRRILSGTGDKSGNLLYDLYNLWFDDLGNPTNYVRVLRGEGINLSQISILLTDTKFSCVKKFLSLFTNWFLKKGGKTKSVVTLENHGITLPMVCDVLHKSGGLYAQLYSFWFNEKQEKKDFLLNLEQVGIDLKKICSVIKGAEKNVVGSFHKLYNLWFTNKGKKSFYLKTLERENVSLSTIFDILTATGNDVSEVFKNLFYSWFHNNGEKTKLLKNLEAKGRPLSAISKLLIGEGYMAAQKFRELSHSLNNVESSPDRLIRIKTEITPDYQLSENREENPLIRKIKVEENENTSDIEIKKEI